MSKRRPKDPTKLGFLERIMFSFMGPPQVGDVNAPSTHQHDPARDLCHKCHEPWAEHEVVRTASMTYAVCPGT
ncbi:MAG: hypothetical protein JWM64_1054 [Frankiales bacterium]|nr:hypothetical protein [Frankiales bacterium]